MCVWMGRDGLESSGSNDARFGWTFTLVLQVWMWKVQVAVEQLNTNPAASRCLFCGDGLSKYEWVALSLLKYLHRHKHTHGRREGEREGKVGSHQSHVQMLGQYSTSPEVRVRVRYSTVLRCLLKNLGMYNNSLHVSRCRATQSVDWTSFHIESLYLKSWVHQSIPVLSVSTCPASSRFIGSRPACCRPWPVDDWNRNYFCSADVRDY